MIRLAILLGLVAFCAADEGCSCSAEDRQIVQDQWRELWGGGQSSAMKLDFTRVLLNELVEQNPDTRALFIDVDIAHPRGGLYNAHLLRVYTGLDLIIQLLEDPAALEQALDHMADQHHAKGGIKKEYFGALGVILNDKLQRVLTQYDEVAWMSCFRGILGKITSKLEA